MFYLVLSPLYERFTNHFRVSLEHLVLYAHHNLDFPPNIALLHFPQGQHGAVVSFGFRIILHFLESGPRFNDIHAELLHIVVWKLIGTLEYLKLYQLALRSVGLQPLLGQNLQGIILGLSLRGELWRTACEDPDITQWFNANNQPEEVIALPSSVHHDPIILQRSVGTQSILWRGQNEVLLAFLHLHEAFRLRVQDVIEDYYTMLVVHNDLE